MDKDLVKYLAMTRKMESEQLSDEEMEFFLEFQARASQKLPELNKQIAALQAQQGKLAKEGKSDDALAAQLKGISAEALLESGQEQMQKPEYKEQLLRISRDAQTKKITGKLSQGINMALSGWDVASSTRQIKAAERAAAKSKRPTAPGMGRDAYLQRALRDAELGTFDSERAIAPAKAQIADQYKADMVNAGVASAGQSGAYGAYAQLAADRRKRAGLELAPQADAIRAREQARYDQLLGMRSAEGQQIQANNLNLYGRDLEQYNADQQAAASLGAQGRVNQRNAYANLGQFGTQGIAESIADNRYRKAYNQLLQYGSDEAASAGTTGLVDLDNKMGYVPQNQGRPYEGRFGNYADQ